MSRVPEKYYCDFCGAENPKYKNKEMLVLTSVDWSDGYPLVGSTIESCQYDICESCFIKTIRIKAGFRGANPSIIEKGE